MKEIKRAPLTFKAYFKPVIWGGERIAIFKGEKQDASNIGESWEISALPGYESVVDKGEYAGKKITELADIYGKSLLGSNVVDKYGFKFPLLIKFIDANDNVSIQVHPDDRLARLRHGSLGKTEMWYIIDSKENAKIYSGFKVKSSPEEYVESVSNGTITDIISIHDSYPGDVFFLPAGRVHAIGAGNFIAEVQEASDITYRIYDYNRKDSDGNLRELHTELAKDAIDYNVYDDYRLPAAPESEENVEVVRCEHFTTHRLMINGEKNLATDGKSFLVIICLKGELDIIMAEGEERLTQGKTVLIPASGGEIILRGKATLLTATV